MNDRPKPDVRLETIEHHSILDGLDHFSGLTALLVTVMIAVFLYFWLGLNKPPKLAILWVPPMAVNMWRRVLSGEDAAPQWPAPWHYAMAAYSSVILAIVLFRGPVTSDDWWMGGFAAFWAAASVWRATRP